MQWLSNLLAPYLDWIQVEVTSRCNAECVYCPNAVYRDLRQGVHMPMELFLKAARAFRLTSLVYLQGWGEPLLHPQFFDMVQIARRSGCRVGVTTNGALIDEEVAERLVSEGLSIVGFSLAGTDERQDHIRRGAGVGKVLQAIELLDQAKRRRGSSLPELHAAYMWLRSQFDAARDLPALLEGTGIRQAVVSTLDFLPREDLAGEFIHAWDAEEEVRLKRIAAEVIEAGKRRGIEIIFRIVAPFGAPGRCTENILNGVVVSCRGFVSPCVFGNMPDLQALSAGDASFSVPRRIIFGSIDDRSLSDVWMEKSYKAFRREHAAGRIPPVCASCPKLFCRVQC
jgi:MoaA/NifB/PqqE/SkfB family radical SAM enzyme